MYCHCTFPGFRNLFSNKSPQNNNTHTASDFRRERETEMRLRIKSKGIISEILFPRDLLLLLHSFYTALAVLLAIFGSLFVTKSPFCVSFDVFTVTKVFGGHFAYSTKSGGSEILFFRSLPSLLLSKTFFMKRLHEHNITLTPLFKEETIIILSHKSLFLFYPLSEST